MTLIEIIRKYLIKGMLLVLLIGCASHYFIFRYFIHYSTDNMLRDQRSKIEQYVAANDTLSLANVLILKPARIEKQQINNPKSYPREAFKDTVMYSEETGSFTPYRQLYFTVSYKGEHQLVNINQPTVISNDLLYAIITSLFVLVILFIAFTYFISYSLKKSIWKPLNGNLRELHRYKLKSKSIPKMVKIGIKEFDEISNVIMRMVRKINEDYDNARTFTEDASHEMQTPLSVIKSKLDLILQKETIKDNTEQEAFSAILKATNRLSRLNKSLLMIYKINNDQFEEKANVDLRAIISSYLEDLEELIMGKGIKIEFQSAHCHHEMNQILAEILVSNLISNSIRHNIIGGEIKIKLTANTIIISNTFEGKPTDKNLFDRMTTANRLKDSHGMGLNIVKTICDKSNLSVSYDYPQKDIFRITVNLN